MNTYSVRLFKTGELGVPMFWVYYLAGGLGWTTIAFHALLAQNQERVVLVGCDFPEDSSEVAELWSALGETYAGPDGKERMTLRRSEQSLDEQLRMAGVAPNDVTHLVLSPLLTYTAGTLDRFRNAEILTGRQGWEEFMVPDFHATDARSRRYHRPALPRNIYIPRPQLHYLLDHWDRFRTLDDEDEVCPGITTFFVGVHHRSSLAVKIDTECGTIIYTDAGFHNANVEDDIPLGILEDMREAYNAYARIRREATTILVSNEPTLLERYPDGVVA